MIRTLIASTLLTLTGSSITSAQVNIQDSLALVALYDATNGDNWNNNDNWLSGPVSTWFGVSLLGDRVNIIYLYENGLVGDIPQEIAQLTQLQSLQLGASSFSGSIPDIFEQLPELSQLELDGCGLTGEIPTSLGTCLKLKRIDLDNNNLTGTIPSSIAACSQLIVLNVGENNLSGPFPEVIQAFPNLSQLTLSDNNFTGSLPDWIASLTELAWLNLGGNAFSGPAPFLGDKPKLTQLNISDNTLTGNLEDILGYYDKLRYCFVINTDITGTLSPDHFNPDEIIILDVSESQIHSLGFFADWIDHPNLLGMTVSDNYLDFDDLLPNSTMPDNRFFYSPQKPIGNDTVVSLLPGEEYAIYSPMQDGDIQYQWYFNQMLIEGLENYDLILPPFTPELVGDFYFTATHDALPHLTLQSAITTLVEGTSAVSDPKKDDIRVFPNPVADHFTIEIDRSAGWHSFSLLNEAGQVLRTQSIRENTTRVSTFDLPAGVYFLQLHAPEKTSIKKISKF